MRSGVPLESFVVYQTVCCNTHAETSQLPQLQLLVTTNLHGENQDRAQKSNNAETDGKGNRFSTLGASVLWHVVTVLCHLK